MILIQLIWTFPIFHQCQSQQDIPVPPPVEDLNTLLLGKWTLSPYCDQDLGCFYPNGSYCDQKCDRIVVCFPPQTPQWADTKLIVSNRQQMSRKFSYTEGYAAKGLLGLRRNIILVPGGQVPYTGVTYINASRDEWLIRDDVNVIVFDYSRINQPGPLIIANIRVAGASLAFFIKNSGIARRTTCVGHSLGAQICGEAGKRLKQRGHTLAKCTGLDPASPWFEGCDNEVKLDKSDCGLVVIVHTNANFVPNVYVGQGTSDKSGHCDFWVNCGFFQPKCPATLYDPVTNLPVIIGTDNYGFILWRDIISACSPHVRAFYYYNLQVSHTCRFVGDECKDCGISAKVGCSVRPGGFSMLLPPDDSCTSYYNVDLYVRTEMIIPYC